MGNEQEGRFHQGAVTPPVEVGDFDDGTLGVNKRKLPNSEVFSFPLLPSPFPLYLSPFTSDSAKFGFLGPTKHTQLQSILDQKNKAQCL